MSSRPEMVGEASFEVFYRSTRDRVAAALALATGSVDLGAEAADEAMARAYPRWRDLEGTDNPAGWVYRVGLNWARSTMRKRRDVPVDVFEGEARSTLVRDPQLHQALAELPVKYRAVVVCRYYLDWDVAQTATALGVAPGTVKSRLNRALRRLRAQIKEGPDQ